MAFSVRSETLYGAVSDRNQGVEASYPVTQWGFCASYPCNSELCRIRGLDPQRGHTLAQGYSKDAIKLKLLPPTGHFGLLCKTSHQFGRVSDSDQQKERAVRNLCGMQMAPLATSGTLHTIVTVHRHVKQIQTEKGMIVNDKCP